MEPPQGKPEKVTYGKGLIYMELFNAIACALCNKKAGFALCDRNLWVLLYVTGICGLYFM